MVQYYLVFLSSLFIFNVALGSDHLHVVAVGEAEVEKSSIHFQDITPDNSSYKEVARSVVKILKK